MTNCLFTSTPPPVEGPTTQVKMAAAANSLSHFVSPVEVPVLADCSPQRFRTEVLPLASPCVLRGSPVGPCVSLWQDLKYMKAHTPDSPVVVHVGLACGRIDFRSKNFKYCSMGLHELLERAAGKSAATPSVGVCTTAENHSSVSILAPPFNKHIADNSLKSQKTVEKRIQCGLEGTSEDSITASARPPIIGPGETYYLRSLGEDKRRSPACIFRDFPGIGKDVQLKDYFDFSTYFSSVLRVSSSGLKLFTHYDVMHNLYLQVVGRKRVVLWPPSAALNLYLEGDKSQVVDIDTFDPDRFPLFPKARRLEVTLEPGDILFIPALWFHHTTALEYSVAVNVFWQELDKQLYDPKDTYGNKDHVPAARAMQMLGNVLKQLEILPKTYRDFYGRKLIQKIQQQCLYD